jgi:thermostable 8-oxoguanine DNA glycosylase
MPDPDILSKFMSKLEKSYGDLGGVACKDLIDSHALSSDPLICELVFSMLVWESSIDHALRAVECIQTELIDLNELRVCTAEELSGILPSRYPKSLERCQRLIHILNAIFEIENCLSLEHLREKSKREVIEYFGSIDGLPQFVSSRVILLGLGWHAFPIDDWLTKQLARHGITDTSLDISDQTHRMERLVRANDAVKYYTLIEHWATNQRSSKLAGNNAISKKKGTHKTGTTETATKGTK